MHPAVQGMPGSARGFRAKRPDPQRVRQSGSPHRQELLQARLLQRAGASRISLRTSSSSERTELPAMDRFVGKFLLQNTIRRAEQRACMARAQLTIADASMPHRRGSWKSRSALVTRAWIGLPYEPLPRA